MNVLLLAAALAGSPGESGFDHRHQALDQVLEGVVFDDGVNYDQLSQRQDELEAYLAVLAGADVSAFSTSEAVAFWVNAYNAHTLNVILENRPLDSIRDLDGGKVWDARSFEVGGETVTLNDMEHKRARPLTDGRVHAVINCASTGCPPLPPDPLRADELDEQLDEGARRWVRTNAYAVDGDTVKVSKIFKWYAEDFEPWALDDVSGPQGQALGFLRAFAPSDAEGLEGTPSLAWNEYDWSLNDR